MNEEPQSRTAVLDPTDLLEIDAGKPFLQQVALQLPNAAKSALESFRFLRELSEGGLEQMNSAVSSMTVSRLGGYLRSDKDDAELALATAALLDAIPTNGGFISVPERIARAMAILSEKLAADW